MVSIQDLERVEALFAGGQKVKAMFQTREIALNFLPGHETRLQEFVQRNREGTWKLPRDIPLIEADFYYWIGQQPPEDRNAAEALTYCARWLNDTPRESPYVRDDYASDAFIRLWGLVPRSAPEGSATLVRPPKAQDQQEQEVIRAVIALGFNPLAIPVRRRGQSGVKSQIKESLGTKNHWVGSTVFDKTWERLRSKGGIKDASSS